MAETRRRWGLDIGVATAIFVALLAGPWCIIPSIGLPFVLAALLIVPPIWWWLVRGRTDEPVRGAMAGLLIGPLVHLAEFLLLVYVANRPGRGDGEGGLMWMLIAMPLFVAGVASVVFGPLLGLGIVYLMRRFPTKGTAHVASKAV